MNIDKCMVMNFYFKKIPVIFEYSISNNILHSVKISKDLGVLFDSKLSFNSHTMTIKKKMLRNLLVLLNELVILSNVLLL